jgi:hypothetical protein
MFSLLALLRRDDSCGHVATEAANGGDITALYR